ncbi:MAG: hypothetical protein HOP11_14295 [Saprospiraceae bacterium]|nr:hypothetical protein [Saprospiraceae bacterium]
MIQDLKDELTDQGHILTGKTRDSISLLSVKLQQGDLEAFVGLEEIYKVLDTGVSRNKIPYERGSGRKSSKYIDGLIKFWMIKKGLGPDEAKKAAFALANKHKKEGMPTQSSWQHAKNGRRLQFFTRTLDGSPHYDTFENNILDPIETLLDDILINTQNLIHE